MSKSMYLRAPFDWDAVKIAFVTMISTMERIRESTAECSGTLADGSYCGGSNHCIHCDATAALKAARRAGL